MTNLKRFLAVSCMAALLVMLAGCRDFVMQQSGLQKTDHKIGNIAFVEVSDLSTDPKPVILIQHGLGQTKEDLLDMAKWIAYEGYLAVVVDACGYGESKSNERLTLPDIVTETSKGYEAILDFYMDSGRVKDGKFAIAGMSMGGMVALYYDSYGQYSPSCIISLYSTFDWNALTEIEAVYTVVQNGRGFITYDETERAAICSRLKQYSPLNSPERLVETPLLMINGDKDPIIPLPNYDQLYAIQEQEGGIRPEVIVRENQGHTIHEDDAGNTLEFIKKYLAVE